MPILFYLRDRDNLSTRDKLLVPKCPLFGGSTVYSTLTSPKAPLPMTSSVSKSSADSLSSLMCSTTGLAEEGGGEGEMRERGEGEMRER